MSSAHLYTSNYREDEDEDDEDDDSALFTFVLDGGRTAWPIGTKFGTRTQFDRAHNLGQVLTRSSGSHRVPTGFPLVQRPNSTKIATHV